MNRESAQSFQDLIVWQKAHEFVLAVYRCSNRFPKTESYELTSQLEEVSKLISSYIKRIQERNSVS
jgi:four helix bundle protein